MWSAVQLRISRKSSSRRCKGGKSFRRWSAVLLLLLVSPFVRAAGEYWEYVMMPGDTLLGVAHNYLNNPGDWPKLQQLNNITDPKRIPRGTHLRIPVAWLKARPVAATVLWTQGRTEKVSEATAVSILLAVGMTLVEGDMLRVEAGSNVTLRFADGSRLLVTEKSVLTLRRMTMSGNSNSTQTLIELREGAVESHVEPQKGPASRYEVISPALNLGVRGTSFRARIEPSSQRGLAAVDEGVVMASAVGANVKVAGGFGTLAAVGEAPAPARKLLPPPDLSEMAKRFERLPLQPFWPKLAGARAYRVQLFSDHSFEQLHFDQIVDASSVLWPDVSDGEYLLRVRGVDSDGLEGMASLHELTVKTNPNIPYVLSPLEGSKLTGAEVVFSWGVSPSAVAYRLQVATSANFSDPAADIAGITTPGKTVKLVPGRYYWRVAAVGQGEDQGPYSDSYSFELAGKAENTESSESQSASHAPLSAMGDTLPETTWRWERSLPDPNSPPVPPVGVTEPRVGWLLLAGILMIALFRRRWQQ